MIVGLPGHGRFEQSALDLRFVDMRRKDRGNRSRDLVLNCKDVIEVAVIAFRPTMRSGSALDKLSRDTYAVAAAPDAALKDIAHAKFAAYLAQIKSFALVLET